MLNLEMVTVANILPVLVSLPFIGALILSLGQWSRDFARWFALVVKFVVFLVSLELCGFFDTTLDSSWFQCLTEFQLFSNWKVWLGVDGIAVSLIMLTTLIMLISLLVAWNSIATKWRAFAINLLVLEGFLLLSFSVLDLFIFYLAFESVLIPMFLIIGMWGSRLERIKAAWYFFFFTLVGSIFLLIAIIVIYVKLGTTSFFYMNLPSSIHGLVWVAFFVAFAVKIPTWPFHLWLP